MMIIEKDSLFTLTVIQLIFIGILNVFTFKKVDILNKKQNELITTFHDLNENRKKL